jgi:hypothetical protein
MLGIVRKGSVETIDRQVIMQGVVQVCLYSKMVAEREHVIGKRLTRKRVVAVTLL